MSNADVRGDGRPTPRDSELESESCASEDGGRKSKSSNHSSRTGSPRRRRPNSRRTVSNSMHERSRGAMSHVSSSRASSNEGGVLEQVLDIKRLIEEKERKLRDEMVPHDAEAWSEENEAKAEKQLLDAIHEFCATEANYLQDLRFTMDKYGTPLASLISTQEHYDVFANYAQLVELHGKLGAALAVAREEPNERRSEATLKAFLDLLPYFKMYASYCAHYPHVAKALETVKRKEKVRELMTAMYAAHQTTLQALLFRPVQRMCLYPLLFQRMVNSAPEGLTLHKRCSQALHGMEQLNGEVNETVRRMEERYYMMEVLQEVRSKDVEDLVQGNRKLVRETFVDMKCPSASLSRPEWRIRRRYKWFLFDDCLLICRGTTSGWTKKELWQLADLTLTTSNKNVPAGIDLPADLTRDGSSINGSVRGTDARRTDAARASRMGSVGSVGKEADRGTVESGDSSRYTRPEPEQSEVLGQMRDGKQEKREVMHLSIHNSDYKCWALSENDMFELVTVVDQLRKHGQKQKTDAALNSYKNGFANTAAAPVRESVGLTPKK
mmetsp:Transcript_10385/g.22050  ORF Transcript_10385/g.22050 Transcript_10385/m.22050 type:complete len:553 (-) Transcript_10385:753-2411(-)